VLAARLDEARDGTLFIDGVAEMSRALQQRLLWYLDETVASLAPDAGSERPRLVTGASAGLSGAVRAGRFSEALFYRLNVIRLDLDHKDLEAPMTARDLMSTPPLTCQPTNVVRVGGKKGAPCAAAAVATLAAICAPRAVETAVA
jgi:hypothetical protein